MTVRSVTVCALVLGAILIQSCAHAGGTERGAAAPPSAVRTKRSSLSSTAITARKTSSPARSASSCSMPNAPGSLAAQWQSDRHGRGHDGGHDDDD